MSFPHVFAHCEALSLGRELLRSPVPGQRLEVLSALKALFEAGAEGLVAVCDGKSIGNSGYMIQSGIIIYLFGE